MWLCRRDNVTLDVTSVGPSQVAVTHCQPRNNWPAQDVAPVSLLSNARQYQHFQTSAPHPPGLFLADSSEADRMDIENICSFRLCIHWTSAGHLKMLMTDFTSLPPLRKEEENVSRSLKKLILINRTLGLVLSQNSWQLLDTNKMSRGHCHEWGDHRERVPCHTSHLTLTRHCHDTSVTLSRGPGDNIIILIPHPDIPSSMVHLRKCNPSFILNFPSFSTAKES